MQLPVRVRVWDWGLETIVEVASTFNVSRGGLYFFSDKAFQSGQSVRVALNYASDSRDKVLEQRGEVVRVDKIAGSPKCGVAIKYT